MQCVQFKKRWTWLQSVVLVMFLLSSTLAFAQNRVTGTVTDRTGAPLPGVNVLEVGTTNGNITDIDGKYSIKRQDFAILFHRFCNTEH